jgi:hypothetical protein
LPPPVRSKSCTGDRATASSSFAENPLGRAAYRRPITAWLIDCAAGENMKLPARWSTAPAAVVSFASAHFRPRSLAADPCAVLVVAIEGAEQVTEQKL